MNTTYVVDSEYETFIGTYRGQINNRYFPPYANVLHDVKVRIKNKSKTSIPILVQFISINNNDIVYDLDKIKHDSKKARQAMEQRALNIILKKIVNEEFQWC